MQLRSLNDLFYESQPEELPWIRTECVIDVIQVQGVASRRERSDGTGHERITGWKPSWVAIATGVRREEVGGRARRARRAAWGSRWFRPRFRCAKKEKPALFHVFSAFLLS